MGYFDKMPTDPSVFKDEKFSKALSDYPIGSWVYIESTKQFGIVEDVRASADGPRLRIRGIGSVPVEDLRTATEEEMRSREEK